MTAFIVVTANSAQFVDLLISILQTVNPEREFAEKKDKVFKDPAFREALIAISRNHTNPMAIFSDAVALATLLFVAQEAVVRGMTNIDLNERSTRSRMKHLEALDALAFAKEKLAACSGEFAQVASKIDEALSNAMNSKALRPILSTVTAETSSKRGTGEMSLRAQLIRGIDPLIPKEMSRRLSLIRNLVRVVGMSCTSSNVDSALEYRLRI